jgi:hypothetical protein
LYIDDEITRKKIVIDMDTWEEYVLMYGEKETHRYNKLKIISICRTCEK